MNQLLRVYKEITCQQDNVQGNMFDQGNIWIPL